MGTVFFRTFGCKLNQSETAAIVQDFENHGYRVVSGDLGSDVFVLNTCTVTSRSDAKCRRAIRHVLKLHPDTTVIVVGCYSQMAAEEIGQIPGVDYILGNREKLKIFDYFPGPGKLLAPKMCVSSVGRLKKAVGRMGNYLDHTRALLKIQDGCSYGCSYCIVPLARGPSRSVPQDDVIRQVEGLVQRGFKEIVLTGVHIGMYGKELDNGSSLSVLLRRLLEVEGLGRIRLSSMDPEEITDELLGCVGESERICRHFHIPLQSGSDTILAAMNRRSRTDLYRERVEKIVARFGNVGLGADVIVGFPGETDEHFEETFSFIEELPFTYLHVFPFSPRKGTKAESMIAQIDPRVRSERAERLRDLGEKKKEQFFRKSMGRVLEVLMERRDVGGWMGGFSSEYIRVEVPYEETLRNRFVSVKVGIKLRSKVRGLIV